MPKITTVQGKVQVEIEEFDGGLNTKDSPARIGLTESPECLNVVFDDQGSVSTRNGCSYFNTSTTETGSAAVDGHASYNTTMLVWTRGNMYRSSGTTFVTVPSAEGMFTSGAKVAWAVHQNILFCSDGANGPFRYESGSDFYRMGIAVPSAPTGACNVAGANQVQPGTYYYKISYANSHVVEGEPGSASVAVTLTTTSAVNVTSIPTASASLGVATRYVYRASTTTGPFRRVGTLSNNTTSIFTDTMGATTWSVQVVGKEDATAPTVFNTIRLHKERLFFDDFADRTIVRYTDYQTPFISQAENFIPLNEGDGANIQAIGVQNDVVSVFKDNSTWLIALNNPGDDTTWDWTKVPENAGIVGPRAFVEIPGAIMFMAKVNGTIAGMYLLQGAQIIDAETPQQRTYSISERIETDVLAFPSGSWDDIAMASRNNKIYMACAISGDTSNAHLYWFDLTRISAQQGQPGSWSLWDGRPCTSNTLLVHQGTLYAGSAIADGRVITLEVSGQYSDAGTAINSYFWTKQIGGEPSIESWIKDFRKVNLWHSLFGTYFMNLRWRLDGDTGDGTAIAVDLTPGGSLWNTFVWGVDDWGGTRTETEVQLSLGAGALGRRIQFRFDNQNTVDQAFKVHSMKLLANLRRQR